MAIDHNLDLDASVREVLDSIDAMDLAPTSTESDADPEHDSRLFSQDVDRSVGPHTGLPHPSTA